MIKSPLNYSGGKFKLLPQILPLFPENIECFVDMFCGGANVGVNVKANKVLCNDSMAELINLFDNLKHTGTDRCLELIVATVEKYQLSITNEEGYKQIRNDYNNGSREWYMFYTLIAHAFNNQIRFNKDGKFNIPFGKRSFNDVLKKKFTTFCDRLHEIDIVFTNHDFRKLATDGLSKYDFVYTDPPYLISCASYNENGGWGENDEKDLLSLLDTLNERHIKFALSNVTHHKGYTNDILINWSRKYNTHVLNMDYSRCNYQRKSQDKSREVLITNY